MPRAQAEGILNRPTRKGKRPLVAITGTAALVGVAGVRAAAVTLLVVMMGAAGVGVKDQRAGKISRRSAVGLAGNAAAQPDAGLCQRHLCTAANAAA